MTNVKIKLTFFVLSALLTADFVYSRPYNETGRIIGLNGNITNVGIKIPVEADSDTLIVAKDETAEQTHKSSQTEMNAMVDAEQDRDELILSKINVEAPKTIEIAKDDTSGLEQQLNASSTLLEDIIDSETGREETLTDIMFRPLSDYEELPRFEFLLASKSNESSEASNNNLEIALGDKNSTEFKKTDYVELVAIGKNYKGENKSAYMSNITVHEVVDDLAPDTSFTDMQTLVMACLATLLPLLGVLFATLLIRCICRRWCHGCKKDEESSDSESSYQKPDTNHTQKSTEDSSATGAENLDNEGGTPAANGSIITMTLKNNHLIVETEERPDIKKNGRETKMKYSPDNDGIFVVEVQQAAVYRPNNKSLQNSPTPDPQISTNQALIHRNPDEITEISIEEGLKTLGDKALALSNTGLSISDLSVSSIGSHNASYSYGDQIGYEQGPFGYPVYAGYDIPKEFVGDGMIHESSREPLITKTPTDPDKPVVTAAIFKQDSIIGNDALQGPYCIEGSSDGPLLSDVQAREVSLQNLHDKMEKKLENGITQLDSPKKFSRADSLPMKLENEKTEEAVVQKVVMETIEEDSFIINKELLKEKRASLPIIKTDMFESVTDDITVSGSLKFDQLTNDFSQNPVFFCPPMITISEDNEGEKSENGDS